MNMPVRTSLWRGCAAVAVSGVMAVGLAGCAEDEPITEGDNAMVEDSGDTGDSGDTADTADTGDAASEDDNDAVDVAAIQDESAGSDGTYDGAFDGSFRDDIESFDGDRVTVSAKVERVISDNAFTIGGVEDPDVEELLVIHANPLDFLEEGTPVLVTGVVHKAYTLAQAEAQLDTELTSRVFEEWDAEPYIETDTVGELAELAA